MCHLFLLLMETRFTTNGSATKQKICIPVWNRFCFSLTIKSRNMMNFPQHLKAGMIGGALTSIAFSTLTHEPEKLVSIFCLTVLGSLAPDLDTQSKPSKFAAIALTIAGVIALYRKELYPIIYFLIGFSFIKCFNHRSWTHVYLVPLSLFIIGYKTNVIYFIPIGIGVMVHYLIDKLWPWKLSNWHKFKLPKMLK